MPNVVRVKIKKDIFHWALSESQKEKEEVINKFPKFTGWVKGSINPTFKQLQDLANFLKIPFGYLFLEKPPEKDPMEAEFRSINNKLPVMSKNLKDTITAMDMRRNWMSDYRKDLGWDRLDIIERFDLEKRNKIGYDASLAKELLGLKDDWYRTAKKHGEAYKFLKNKMEDHGILIMQNGVVGSNNYRKLDINEFRAFMLYDDIAPVIFINHNDSLGGKIFSLVHEYIHILLKQEDLFLQEDIYSIKENERYINRITAEFLMPTKHIRVNWSTKDDPFEQINQMANLFKVSETALAIKLNKLVLISEEILNIIISEAIEKFIAKSDGTGDGGGDFYRTFNTRTSPTFTEAVVRSAEAGDISYTYAFRLLGGLRGKTYDGIKERLLLYG